MAKYLVFDGLPRESHTWFEDLEDPRYSESDLLWQEFTGDEALRIAKNNPQARLKMWGTTGTPVDVSSDAKHLEELRLRIVDGEIAPSDVWAVVPQIGADGVQSVRPGASPMGYAIVHVNCGQRILYDRVRNADGYVERGQARVVEDAGVDLEAKHEVAVEYPAPAAPHVDLIPPTREESPADQD